MLRRSLVFGASLIAAGGLLLAQSPAVVITATTELQASVLEAKALRATGAQVAVVAAPGCFVVRANTAQLQALRAKREVLAVVDVALPDERIAAYAKPHHAALRWLGQLLRGELDARPTDPVMDWTAHPEGDLLERGQGRRGDGALKSGAAEALDWTCSESSNSERLTGTVLASFFFVESNGAVDPNTYTWTQVDIDLVKAQAIDSWSIWSYSASLYGRSLTVVMNWYEPAGGIPVQPYEPIIHSSGEDHLWIQSIMLNLGYTQGGYFAELDAFNHDMRGQFVCDHAVSAFMAYNPSSQGAPNQMTDGKIGYAYLGGPYTQLLFKANGWATNQINRVYGHENGHLFHAFDEYVASGAGNCSRAFNGEQNLNFQGSTCNGSAACVMVANSFSGSGATRQWDLCTHTPYHVGWSGTVAAATPTAPINDVILTQSPVVLHWNRNGAPTGVTGYVKIFDRNTEAMVYCGSTTADSVQVTLVNGAYRWLVGQGIANDFNGYAGILSTEALFTLNAPLHADFSILFTNICAGSTTSFSDLSTGAPSSWTWQFPGGTPSSFIGKVPPAILFSTAGSYTVSLTVGDGLTNDTRTIVDAITVTGGAPITFSEDFNGGLFPPTGWTLTGGGYPGGQGGMLNWQADATGSCNLGASAYVAAYDYSGLYAGPTLTTPKLDLTTAVDPYLAFRYSYAQESSTVTETLRIPGHDCSYSVYAELLALGGAALATNGGAYVTGQGWAPTTCAHWKDRLVRIDALEGRTAQIDFRLESTGGQNFFFDDVKVFEGCRLNLRALLEGPCNVNTGIMGDALRSQGLVPTTEPYSAMGYAFIGEGGGETIDPAVLTVTGNDAIVDWTIVEVRDAADAAHVLTSRAALIQRDGDLVDRDGVSKVRLGVPAGSYFVAVRHRGHLGAMTAATVALSQNMALVDLSLPATPAYGVDARKVANGRAMLWCGDVTFNGVIQYTGSGNDRDPILARIGGIVPTNTATGYFPEDPTMDGVVKYTGTGNDRDVILQNIGGVVPTNTRVQQLP